MRNTVAAVLIAGIACAGIVGAVAHAAPTRDQAVVLQLKAVGAIAYNKKALRAPHGKVTIRMTNTSPLKHDVAIKGKSVTAKSAKGKLVATGGISIATATLKAGKYTFLCTVPGHAAAGMKGILTVK